MALLLDHQTNLLVNYIKENCSRADRKIESKARRTYGLEIRKFYGNVRAKDKLWHNFNSIKINNQEGGNGLLLNISYFIAMGNYLEIRINIA